jgi:hypothetical protein
VEGRRHRGRCPDRRAGAHDRRPGRYITAGFICGDDCDPKATLRVHDPKGGDDWFVPIGDLPSLSYGPHDIAWSPAGYAVVVMGGAKGNETAFWVRAFKPGSAAPLWTYSREDNKNFHMAIARRGRRLRRGVRGRPRQQRLSRGRYIGG